MAIGNMSGTIIYVVVALWASAHSVDAAVNCTSAGRVADDSVADCQGYVLCVLNTDGTYLQYNYTCPTTSVFNPNTALCTASTNYACNTTDDSTTTVAPTTVSTSVCTADGYIADDSSTDCSAYIQCVSINGTFTETTLTCPTDTYYDPSTTLCSTTYDCTTTTTVAATTVATFTCTAAGRFADTSVSGCQSYYLCVLQTDSTYVYYTYTCPTTSVFNPSTAMCTSSYTCTT